MASKGNRVRNPKTEEESEVAEKPKSKANNTKSKSKKTENRKFSLDGIKVYFQNEKLHKVTGLFLLLLSVFMLVAFTSFFVTWNADHDKVSGSWWTLFTRPDIQVDNWLGKFGAILSHQLIEKWFGVSAFVFVLLSFLTGFKILFKVELLPIAKTVKYSFFAFVFVAATLGYALGSNGKLLFLAGSFGFEINRWLQSTLGNIGTGLFLAFAAIAFIAVAFNIVFKLPSFLKPKEASQEDIEAALINTVNSPIPGNRLKDELVEEVVDIKESLELELVPSAEGETEEEEEEDDEDETENPEVDEAETISFAIENEILPVSIHNTEMEVQLPVNDPPAADD